MEEKSGTDGGGLALTLGVDECWLRECVEEERAFEMAVVKAEVRVLVSC